MIIAVIAFYIAGVLLWYLYNEHLLEVAEARFVRGKLHPRIWQGELEYRHNLMRLAWGWGLIVLFTAVFWVVSKIRK